MTPPRRRSSRLRGSSATPAKSRNYATNRLQSLVERDETPNDGVQSNLDAIASSPLAPRTPASTGRIQPSREEMHPSKAHHSTTQEPDSGLRLGFTDIKAVGNDQPSGLTQQTPTKLGISSPTFDFRFARPGPQLGPEAQRMMDDLREEALRIKAKLAAEREEEKRREGESAGGIGGRKIAQPKGKVGRFSDIHMAEFKKMDSIAGHPSAFRAQPGRFTPVTNTLKRTQSKAQLDERVDGSNKKHGQSSEKATESERLENTAPAKRARKHVTDDTSSARPVSSHDSKPLPSTPPVPRSQSSMLATISTPTQASLARAASTKKPATQIPTLSRSPSKPNLVGTPRVVTKSTLTNDLSGMSKSESRPTLHSPSKFDRMKSILRRPSSTAKKPTRMPSTIPMLSRSPSKPNFEKSLPSIPTTPGGGDSKTSKHVNFTPDTVNNYATMIQNSPSPMKSSIPRSTSRIQLGPKPSAVQASSSRPGSAGVQYPSIATLPNPTKQTQEVEYPSLDGVRPLPLPPRQATSQPPAPPSVPGTFTFRSDHTISFGASPKGFESSPGQSSVRQVRQSIFPSSMPGSFPSGNKENTEPLPAVPHGMANKKRRRVEADDETEEEPERSPKKHKAAAEGAMLMAPNLQSQNKTPNSRISSPAKKKGVLSLSRLNMLARPKVRK
ncbi:related to glucan 1,4-alpha-glucosidase [Phialocephala subalpina]|uniref:Related to glucan 1,4-alpha-glucosidase n=1 Tax=Phialocephala subalpina TaxID=576137 RepID=A0A1L7WNT4_9HELO|nr:related to glucan 1,4-alpha-glucosidase [Phialocephala subalpina]